MRKLIPRYVVYRVHMDLRGCRELSKPGGQNEFPTRKQAEDAITKNTNASYGRIPLWYEDFKKN